MFVKNSVICLLACVALLLSSCANVEPFSGDWVGSGVDAQGNEFTFAAKVTAMGEDNYRVLILDALDTTKDPMHIMDGILKDGVYEYTADDGLYTGGGTLTGDVFSGFYEGPVDGTFTMQRVD